MNLKKTQQNNEEVMKLRKELVEIGEILQ